MPHSGHVPSQRVGAACRNMGSRTHCAASSGQITRSRGSSGSGGEVKPVNSLKPESQRTSAVCTQPLQQLSPGLCSLPLTLPRMRSPPEAAQVAPGHQHPLHPLRPPPPPTQGWGSFSKPVGQNSGRRPRSRRVGCHPDTASLEGGWVGSPWKTRVLLEGGIRHPPQGEPRGVGPALGPQETQNWRAVTGH